MGKNLVQEIKYKNIKIKAEFVWIRIFIVEFVWN